MGPARSALRVIVTRPREQVGALAERLDALGFEVVLCPLLELEPTGPAEVDVAGYDWVVVTSPRGAHELAGARARRAAEGRGDRPGDGGGPARARRRTGRSCRRSRPRKVSWPSFRSHPAVCSSREQPMRGPTSPRRSARTRSSSTGRASFAPRRLPRVTSSCSHRPRQRARFAALGLDLPAVSIGPETTREARAQGIDVVAEADRHDLDGLVEAVAGAARGLCAGI